MTLLANLERAARRSPNKVVLIDAARTLTYRQLLAAVETRSALLQEGRSVGARIGVLLQPSVELVITYFACLRTGMVYTPLSRLPAPAMSKVLALLRLDVLVTDEALDYGVPTLTLPAVSAVVPAAMPCEDVNRTAHILLTSGTSTGSPKAVTTDQLGSLRSHAWRTALMPYRPDDAVGCNIFGIWDAVPALFNGVPAVMIPDAAMREPSALAATLVRHAITRLMMTPTLLAACLNSAEAVDALGKLRWLVLCGELVTDSFAKRVRRALPRVAVLNLYSTAECHDVAAVRVGDDGELPALEVAGFARVAVADVNHRERLLPAGQPGRILVNGPGVASGCFGDGSERFFKLAGVRWGDTRVYDTGDLGVLTAAGRLRVLGRCDVGVKIRGHWVNPEHVADVLAGHPGVADISVRASDGKLAALVVPVPSANAKTLGAALRRFAAARMAAHAVPGRIETVPALPLTSSGKADRRVTPTATPVPSGDLGGEVLAAFRRVLDDPTVAPHDDFTNRGGDSLSAIALCGTLQQHTGRRIRVADFLRHPTPAALAAFIAKGTQAIEVKDWRLPELGRDIRIGNSAPAPAPPRTLLVTGASGYIGQAFVHACRGRFEVLALVRGEFTGANAIRGDLTAPHIGLSPRRLTALGERIDAIVHIAADAGAFTSYDDLVPLNVRAVEALVRLAAVRTVPLVHVSSSAIFPLGDGEQREVLPDAETMPQLARRLASSGADAYSRTKLAAEALLRQAARRGLPVSVVRIPHVLGHPRNDRLTSTLRALIAAGVFPDADTHWQWQFTIREVACRALMDAVLTRQDVRHATLAPVAAEEIFRCLTAAGFELRPTTLPAIATAVDRVSPSHRYFADAATLGQLISEYGPRAALSMDDALLTTAQPFDVDPAQVLRRQFRAIGD